LKKSNLNKGAKALGKVIKSTDQMLREMVKNFPNNLDDGDLVAALNQAFLKYDDFNSFVTFIEAGLSAHLPETIAIQMVLWDEKDVHLIKIADLRAMIKT
jgi:hypothetical protein